MSFSSKSTCDESCNKFSLILFSNFFKVKERLIVLLLELDSEIILLPSDVVYLFLDAFILA